MNEYIREDDWWGQIDDLRELMTRMKDALKEHNILCVSTIATFEDVYNVELNETDEFNSELNDHLYSIDAIIEKEYSIDIIDWNDGFALICYNSTKLFPFLKVRDYSDIIYDGENFFYETDDEYLVYIKQNECDRLWLEIPLDEGYVGESVDIGVEGNKNKMNKIDKKEMNKK